MSGYALLALISFVILFIFSKPLRHFLLRALLGLCTLSLAKLFSPSLVISLIGILTSLFLGAEGALSYLAFFYILK